MPRGNTRSQRIRQARRVRMDQRRNRPIRKFVETEDTVVAQEAADMAAGAVSGIDPSQYQEIIDIEARLFALENP